MATSLDARLKRIEARRKPITPDRLTLAKLETLREVGRERSIELWPQVERVWELLDIARRRQDVAQRRP